MPVIFSTITNDTTYPAYHDAVNNVRKIKYAVTIKGGANRGGQNIITPRGVATTVTHEELEFLKGHAAFQRHKERGYITFDESASDVRQEVADKRARDMNPQDESAPLTDKDYKPGGRQADAAVVAGIQAPTVGKEETKASKKKGKDA